MSAPDNQDTQGRTAPNEGHNPAGTTNVLAGLCLLFGGQWAGDALVKLLGWPVPGAIVGIALVLLLIRFPIGSFALGSMAAAAHPLLRNLPLFLVPVGVSLIDQSAILRREGLLLLAAVVGSTMITMVAAQLTFALTLRWTQRP